MSNNRVIPAAILLSGKASEYNYILTQMHSKQDLVTDAFRNMRDTANQQWKMMEIGIQNVLIVLGIQLLPVLQNLYHAVYEVANAFLNWIETASNMTALKYALLGIAIVVATILTPAIVGLGVAFLTNPMFLAIMAIVAAGILLGNIIHQVVQHFGGWAGVLKQIHPLLMFFKGLLDTAGRSLHQAFANPEVHRAITELQRDAVQFLPVLKLLGAILLGAIVVAFVLATAAIRGMAAMLPGLIRWFGGLLTFLGGFARLIIDIFTGKWKDIPAAFKQMGQGILQGLGGLKDAALGLLGGFINGILAFFGSNTGKVAKGAQGMWDGVLKSIGGVFSSLGTSVHNSLSSLGKSIGSVFSNLGTTVHNGLSSLGRTIGGIFSGLGTFVHNGLMKIGDAINWFVHQTPQKIAYLVGYAIGYLAALPIRGLELIAGLVVGAAKWLDHLRVEAAERLVKFVEDAITFLEHLRAQAQAKIIAFVVGAATSIARFAQAAPGYILKMAVQIVLWLGHMKDEAIKHIIAFAVAAVAELTKLWHEAPGFILKLVLQVVTYFTNLRNQATQKVQDTRTSIWKELQKLPGQALQAAKDFVMGLVHGIENNAKWVWDAIQHLASGMIDGFKNALGIHSPSTVMFTHGVNLVQGLILGFKSINVGAEWLRHVGTLRPPTLAPIGEGGYLPGVGQAGGGYGRFRLPQGGGGVQNHTWNLNFPNAKHTPEIRQAILEVQQETYRRARRPGSYGGFGSDYTSDS